MSRKTALTQGVMAVLFVSACILPGIVSAHCDTLEGPVVSTAKAALENGDVTPVLKWVKEDDEKEIRELFAKTLSARKQGKEARELADRYFFETLVRVHRAGEKAPFTGLKPAGARRNRMAHLRGDQLQQSHGPARLGNVDRPSLPGQP